MVGAESREGFSELGEELSFRTHFPLNSLRVTVTSGEVGNGSPLQGSLFIPGLLGGLEMRGYF